MNNEYEHNQQGLLFFVISKHNMSSNIIKLYIYMDSRLNGLFIESKNIRNGGQTKKL